MLKILLLAPYSSVHTKRWVNSLIGEDLNVLVVTADSGSSLNGEQNIFTLPLLFRLLPKSTRFVFLGLYAKVINFFFKADIIHAHYLSSYGIAAALFFDKYLVSVWGSDINLSLFKGVQKKLLKYSLKKAEHVFVTSRFLLSRAQEFRSEGVTVIPFGVDTDKFKPCLKAKGEFFHIGCTKWMSDVYGISFLIDLLENLINSYGYSNVRLYLTGDAIPGCKFNKKVQELGLENFVYFMGVVDFQKMPEVYSILDLACFPSIHESFGVSVLEASASGVPVLTSNVEGLKEVVLDGVTGSQFALDDAEGFVKQVIRHINNPELGERMGREGRKFVMNKYGWSQSVEKMVQAYKELK